MRIQIIIIQIDCQLLSINWHNVEHIALASPRSLTQPPHPLTTYPYPSILPPFRSAEELRAALERERTSIGVQQMPFHYFEISHLIFRQCAREREGEGGGGSREQGQEQGQRGRDSGGWVGGELPPIFPSSHIRASARTVRGESVTREGAGIRPLSSSPSQSRPLRPLSLSFFF